MNITHFCSVIKKCINKISEKIPIKTILAVCIIGLIIQLNTANSKVSSLQRNVSSIESETSSLKRNVSSTRPDATSISKRDLSSIESEVSSLRRDMSSIESELAIMKIKVRRL